MSVLAGVLLVSVETLGWQAAHPQMSGFSLVDPHDYVIAPDDVLEIYIIDVPELSRTYAVSQAGEITFPLLPKPLKASGLTLAQFSETLAEELKSSGMLTDPHVTISPKESRSHTITVGGAVKMPQVYPFLGKAKLLSVLAQAGGVTDEAGNTVKITHPAGPGKTTRGNGAEPEPPQTTVINLNELMKSANPGLNVDVYPGDEVTVPPAGIIYVVGAVNRSGGFVLSTSREHLTVLQAVALAENVKSTAARERAMIIRRDPFGTDRREIAVNLKNIVNGKSADVPLEPNDILFVPDSNGKKALIRGAEAAVQITTGLILFRGN